MLSQQLTALIAPGALVMVVAAACGGGSVGQGGSPSATPTEGAIPSPTPEGTATPTPGTTPVPTPEATPTPTPETTPTPWPRVSIPPSPAAPPPVSEGQLREQLRSARLSTFGWRTNFGIHSVPFEEIQSGGPPKDGIPPIDAPSFVTTEEASKWLADREPVQAVEINGDARAYPLQILIWHEIVNDTVGGKPVAVTYCPLCNTAIVFDRTLEGVVLDFGTTGNLRFSDLVMYDRQTESWWQQITGEAIVGDLTGRKLTSVSAPIISFEEFRKAHPDGKVLSQDTGYSRPYGQNPYIGYDTDFPFLYRGPEDDRLRPLERVATVSIGDEDVAFPFSVLGKNPVVHYTLGGQDLVVFYQRGTASALDSYVISDSRDVGATGIFDPHLNGTKLTFEQDGDLVVDEQTGSMWNLLGKATEGPLQGQELTPVVHANHFWFSWAVFKPDTVVYKG